MTSGIYTMIKAGDLDEDLGAIRHAAEERLKKIRYNQTVKDFPLGTSVTFNDLANPQALRGTCGIVTGIARSKLVVSLNEPVGIFVQIDTDGFSKPVSVMVPPQVIDAVNTTR
jgi:hypothetical protein